ncbi:hypothetical protein WLF18_12795 [Pseudomonas shirazensis]|uniref:DUF1311 domain-containing protein n=1 Tax=Pseudomonas shirazensis TaxID=2745494 RepID=A0ABU9A0X0_9PSED
MGFRNCWVAMIAGGFYVLCGVVQADEGRVYTLEYCQSLDTSNGYFMRNQCAEHLRVQAAIQFQESVKPILATMSKDKADKYWRTERDNLMYSKKCKYPEKDSSTSTPDELPFIVCRVNEYNDRSAFLTKNPPKTDIQLAEEKYLEAKTIKDNRHSDDDETRYRRVMLEAANLGNNKARLDLVDLYANGEASIQDLLLAEKMLNLVEKTSGVTDQTQSYRGMISTPLNIYREANSPKNLRKVFREKAFSQKGQDVAVDFAFQMDSRIPSGDPCDTIALTAYQKAYADWPLNARLNIVGNQVLDLAIRSGCYR